MNLIRGLLAVMAFGVALTCSAEPFQVPTSGDNIRAAFREPHKHTGQVIALAGVIQEVKSGPQSKPLLRLLLRNPNEAGTTLWVGVLFSPQPEEVKPGEIVRVLGYLATVEIDDAVTRAVVHDPLMLLGICMYLEGSKRGLFAPEGIKQCEGWQNGAAPGTVKSGGS